MTNTLQSVWDRATANHERYTGTGDKESDIRFMTLGLTGEAGEVANFVKKRWTYGEDHEEAIRFEIADTVAYAFMLANRLGMTPQDLWDTMAHKQQAFAYKMDAKNT